MLPHKKAKNRPKSKSPARPVTAGDGEGDATVFAATEPEPPKSPADSKASTRSACPRERNKSKSPAGKKKSKSPAGRKKSKSPRGRKKSKSPGGRKKSKSPSRSRKAKPETEPEPEPEPWRPRSDSQVPDYETIHVTESLLPLREDFFTVIEHLATDERLKNYTSEFVRLYERVAKAHAAKHEMIAAAEEHTLRAAEDEHTISRLTALGEQNADETAVLRRQVEELRAEVDATRLRELDSKGMIESLREEVERYQEQTRRMVAPAEGPAEDEEDEAMMDYERLKKKIMAEKAEMAETNQLLKKHLAEMYQQQESQHRKNSAATLQVTNLSEKLAQATQDVHRETRLKEKLAEELECLVVERDELAAKEVELGNAVKAAERNAASLQQALREQRASSDRVGKENDALQQRMQEQRHVNDRLQAELDNVRQESRDRALEMMRQEDTINKLRAEVNKARHNLDSVINRLGLQMQRNKQVEEQREELAVSVKAIGRDLDRSQREVDQEKREKANLQKARDLLMSKVVHGQESFKSAASHLLISENQCRSLEADVAQYAREAIKQRRLIARLEQERELLHAEKAELSKQAEVLTEKLKYGEEQVHHFKRLLQQTENKLQAQVNLTEATVLQRNKLEKLYEETLTVRDDLRAQAQITSASEQQLKETLSAHELEAMRLSRALAKADSDKALLTRDLNGLRLRVCQLETVIGDHEKAEVVLKRTVADLERERNSVRQDLRGVQNERDIIGTQLVRRNDEVHLLLAKIGVLQAMLTNGEEEYVQRLDDIRLLKLEVRKLRQEKVLLQRDLVAGVDLRRELYHLSKDLAFEKQRRAALESELKTPMNLHRWRRLEASDPASLELIHKVNLLQKRLLSQHSLLLAKERQLQDAEKLYLALRATMVKMPGPDVLLRLKKAQHALEHRARKIKSLFAELSMTEATVHDYRVDLNRTREELADFKSMYYTAKKKLDSLGQPLPREPPVAKRDVTTFPRIDSSTRVA